MSRLRLSKSSHVLEDTEVEEEEDEKSSGIYGVDSGDSVASSACLPGASVTRHSAVHTVLLPAEGVVEPCPPKRGLPPKPYPPPSCRAAIMPSELSLAALDSYAIKVGNAY